MNTKNDKNNSAAEHLKKLYGLEFEPISESGYQSFRKAAERAGKYINLTDKIVADANSRASQYTVKD